MAVTNADYTTVTEAPGDGLRREALDMLRTRYAYAAEFCGGRDVLEVACGPGQGLGMLAKVASRVVAGDFTERLLRIARQHYGTRLPFVRLDAQRLPFAPRSFDVIILYEAVYYLADPARFLDECRRVLRPEGRLLLCTANREVADFSPSPFSVRYLTAAELRELVRRQGFQPEILGAFPAAPASARDRVASVVKRMAVAAHLVPKTMKGKAWLKRLFFGRLAPAPTELADGMGDYRRPVPLGPGGPDDGYRVVFVNARLAPGRG